MDAYVELAVNDDALAEAEVVRVYTDGSCQGNPGPGGWAFVTADTTVSGGDPRTTNNRMELRAVIEALRAFEGPVEIVSDSRYVVDCLNQRWYAKWRANGWKRAKGAPVLNTDLWQALLALVEGRGDGCQVAFTWVKGHAGDTMNARADAAARAAAERAATERVCGKTAVTGGR